MDWLAVWQAVVITVVGTGIIAFLRYAYSALRSFKAEHAANNKVTEEHPELVEEVTSIEGQVSGLKEHMSAQITGLREDITDQLRLLKEANEERAEAQQEIDRVIYADRLTQMHRVFTERGYMDTADKMNWNEVYSIYKNKLNGNGRGDEYNREISQIPEIVNYPRRRFLFRHQRR